MSDGTLRAFGILLAIFQMHARQDNGSFATARQNAIAHYGHAPEFYEVLLGDTVGYSEGYWPDGTETLNQAKDPDELNQVDYDVLPAVINHVENLKPEAPHVHD